MGSLRVLSIRYSLSDLVSLCRTPLGRRQLMHGIFQRSRPLIWAMAYLYRRTLIRHVSIVVIVGSFGKTTTMRAVKTVLNTRVYPTSSGNTWSYVAAALLRIKPGSPYDAIEVGIDGTGQMYKYARLIKPNMVVVTSIGSEHNRSLGTLETTRREKSRMIESLSPAEKVYLNGDDPNVLWMKDKTRARVITYGFGRRNDISAKNPEIDWPHGMRFTLKRNEKAYEIQTQLLGRHMVYPLLIAFGIAFRIGYNPAAIISKLASLEPTEGRMQIVKLPSGAFVIRDDFKSSLETVRAALDVLAHVPAKRRIVVLGEVSEPPGSQGPLYRALGKRVSEVAGTAIFLGGNYQRYASGALKAGMERHRLFNAQRSISSAVDHLRDTLHAGDAVLIKGRDTQRLDRIALALMGYRVECSITRCDARPTRCSRCPMLSTGWKGKVVI